MHTLLLIENGIYLSESICLEELSRDRVYEFLFTALPLMIEGAAGSMLKPVAIVWRRGGPVVLARQAGGNSDTTRS